MAKKRKRIPVATHPCPFPEDTKGRSLWEAWNKGVQMGATHGAEPLPPGWDRSVPPRRGKASHKPRVQRLEDTTSKAPPRIYRDWRNQRWKNLSSPQN